MTSVHSAGFPQFAREFTLAPFRVLELSENVILLAEHNSGWCALSKDDYDCLLTHFSTTSFTNERITSMEVSTLEALWSAGLLLADGRSKHEDDRGISQYPSSLLLKLTGTCNYACTYCYDYDPTRFGAQLALDRIKETIDFLLSKRENLNIWFHGGEPLLRFKLLRDIVEFACQTAGNRNRLTFSVQTNGSRFNDDVIAFLREHRFTVGISLDGVTEESNRLRVVRGKEPSPLTRVLELVKTHRRFVVDQCSFLAVASKASAPGIPNFVLWLQDVGVKAFSLTLLDPAGAGKDLTGEVLSPPEVVGVFRDLVSMVQNSQIRSINMTCLTNRIGNLFTLVPKNFCNKGPCGASSEFLVLDAEGVFRTCDVIYHDFFRIGERHESVEKCVARRKPRIRIVQRHDWLRENGSSCAKCPLFGVCGATCPASAISKNGDPLSVNGAECEVSRYLYPLLFAEFVGDGPRPLFEYYDAHRRERPLPIEDAQYADRKQA